MTLKIEVKPFLPAEGRFNQQELLILVSEFKASAPLLLKDNSNPLVLGATHLGANPSKSSGNSPTPQHPHATHTNDNLNTYASPRPPKNLQKLPQNHYPDHQDRLPYQLGTNNTLHMLRARKHHLTLRMKIHHKLQNST